jgi:hypothetical protein
MQKTIESIILQNDKGQRLRIYKVEDGDTYCIGVEDGDDHFEFSSEEAQEVCNALGKIVGCEIDR